MPVFIAGTVTSLHATASVIWEIRVEIITVGSPANLVYRQQPYGLPAGIGVLGFLLCTAAGVLVYASSTCRFGPSALENETRCRKCGYILRGIPEPRCSECGERI